MLKGNRFFGTREQNQQEGEKEGKCECDYFEDANCGGSTRVWDVHHCLARGRTFEEARGVGIAMLRRKRMNHKRRKGSGQKRIKRLLLVTCFIRS